MKNNTPFWTKGDLDGFFGLFTNSLANTLAALFFLSVVAGLDKSIVFGPIISGLVMSLAFGNIYLAWMAHRLGVKENRNDVTAIPYGISVPHYFIIAFAIVIPELANGRSMKEVWAITVAWCFIHAIILFVGAFLGPLLLKITPRAALLGSLAGVGITYIGAGAAFNVFGQGDYVWLGMVCFGIVLFGWVGGAKLPFNIPAGMFAIIVGTILGWLTGYMQPGPLQEAVNDMTVTFPILQIGLLVTGFKLVGPYLIMAIPLAIYLYMETLLNIESASVAGDKYNPREVIFANAGGTAVAALFGSPFPTLCYIGHPGWKKVGGRVGYSWATGAAMLILGCFGILGVLSKVIPGIAILPILIFIGMAITSQAFNESPKKHAPAVALAMLPWFGEWVALLVRNTTNAFSQKLDSTVLTQNGVNYDGMVTFGGSAIIVGLILGAICVFIIDKDYKKVMFWSLFAAASSFFGVIHASHYGFGVALPCMYGYLAISLIALYLHLTECKKKDTDEKNSKEAI